MGSKYSWLSGNDNSYNHKEKLLWMGGCLIFDNGKWAEIIKEKKPTKEDLLKQIEELKEKINLL